MEGSLMPLSRLSLLVALWTVVAGARPGGAQTLPDDTIFDRVLEGHVRDGLVDYRGLVQHRQGLDLYLGQLARTSPADLELASRDVRLAFWINAYNACALRLVLDHYPLRKRGNGHANSVRQIPEAWTRQFCRVAQRERSLDGIVHGIIRPLGEPRAHFAVACPSRSCPPLAAEAYRGDHLDTQLDAAVTRFLTDSSRYALTDGAPPTLQVNKLLDWYKEDFGGTTGVVAFLRRFVPPHQARILEPGRVRVEYFAYDWTLNDAPRSDPEP
jgi:hypothetical protein